MRFQVARRAAVLFALGSSFAAPAVSLAAEFECSFRAEQKPRGKSNAVSCTGAPEIAFSSPQYSADPAQHCRDATRMSDVVEFMISSATNTVTWREVFRPRPGTSDSADKTLAHHSGAVLSYSVRETFAPFKELGGFDRNGTLQVHIFTFYEDTISGLQTLFVPEGRKDAILARWSAPGTWTGVELLFGTCIQRAPGRVQPKGAN